MNFSRRELKIYIFPNRIYFFLSLYFFLILSIVDARRSSQNAFRCSLLHITFISRLDLNNTKEREKNQQL